MFTSPYTYVHVCINKNIDIYVFINCVFKFMFIHCVFTDTDLGKDIETGIGPSIDIATDTDEP